MAGFLALQEGQIAKDVDGILLIDRTSPEVQQPLVVRLDVHRVGVRTVGRVLEDVCVTEVQVSGEVDLVHCLKCFCLTLYPYSIGKTEMLHAKRRKIDVFVSFFYFMLNLATCGTSSAVFV